jgi:CheY-like chemotaxis protein
MVDRILNVDKDLQQRSATTDILRREGLEVQEAATSAEALDLAAVWLDVVLLTFDLPDLSGFDMCRRLRGQWGIRAPLIVFRSCSVAGDWDVEPDAFLPQAALATALMGTVHTPLRLRRLESEGNRQVTRIAELEREVHTLENLAAQSLAAVTAQFYGYVSMRETQPGLFQELVGEFGRLLEMAQGPPHVEERLSLALILMGYLLSYKRLRSFGGRGRPTSDLP